MELLARQAVAASDSIVILASNRIPLSYGQLNQQVQSAAETLRRGCIGQGRNAAMALPNGPEMAQPHLAQPEPAEFGWKQLVCGGVEVEVVPCGHDNWSKNLTCRDRRKKSQNAYEK